MEEFIVIPCFSRTFITQGPMNAGNSQIEAAVQSAAEKSTVATWDGTGGADYSLLEAGADRSLLEAISADGLLVVDPSRQHRRRRANRRRKRPCTCDARGARADEACRRRGNDHGCGRKDLGVNEGDCDRDSDCKGNLKCGYKNCPWGDNDDCCKVPPTPRPTRPPPPNRRCTCDRTGARLSEACRRGGNDHGCGRKDLGVNEGDCDSDSDCKGDLKCGKNNCPWGDNDDCCKAPPAPKPASAIVGGDTRCPREYPLCWPNGSCVLDRCRGNGCKPWKRNSNWVRIAKACKRDYKPRPPAPPVVNGRCPKEYPVCWPNGACVLELCRGAGCRPWMRNSNYIKNNSTPCTLDSCTCDAEGARLSEACRRGGNDHGCGRKDLGVGEGDCDSDRDCKGDLKCGKKNCPWGHNDDCCDHDHDAEPQNPLWQFPEHFGQWILNPPSRSCIVSQVAQTSNE